MYIDNSIPLVPYTSTASVPYISEDLIFDLWKSLYLSSSNGPNFIFSPYSVICALMMLLVGSTGHTQLQLARVLFGFNEFNGFNDTLLNQHVSQFDKWNREFLYYTRNMVQTGNFIYSQQEFKPNYTQTIAKLLKAKATLVDFGNPKRTIERINWDMSRVTNGAVPYFLTNLEDNDLNLLLINTIQLNARWAVEFDPKYTNFSGQFWVSPNKAVKATMMAQHSMLTDEELEYSYGYYRNSKSGLEAVKMPYGKGQLSLIIILPPENITIHSYVRDQFNAVAFNAIYTNFRRSTFSPLIIPRFKLSLKHSLKSVLGITNIANFSEMFQKQGQTPVDGVLSEIMQSASIEFHESGAKTVASAYNLDYLTFDAMDNPPPLEQFRANRPFLFAVVSEQSEKVRQFLFAGVVEDPTV